MSAEEKQQRCSEILKEAKKLFAKNGYKDTTMRQISEAANISLGSLYFYFTNKSEIYIALYKESLEKLDRSFDDALSLPAPDIRSRISMMLYSYISFYKNDYESYRLLSSGFFGKNQDLELDSSLMEDSLRIFRRLEGPIQQGIDEGVIRPCDTEKTVISLWAMLDGVLMLPEKTHIKTLESHYEEYYSTGVDIILNGIFLK